MTNAQTLMNDATQYWIYISITPGGSLRTHQHDDAHTHFHQTLSPTLPDLATTPKFPHRTLQRHLVWDKAEGGERQKAEGKRQKMDLPASEACLRCFISHQITYACQQLANQFGTNHGFGKMDLLPSILNDDRLHQTPQCQPTPSPSQDGNRSSQNPDFDRLNRPSEIQNQSKIQNPKSLYTSLPTEILTTFNPDRSNLKTWTVRLVRHNPTVTATLLAYGVYLVSDWAILNDTTEPQLGRILGEFYVLTPAEIQQFTLLLESYHAIYRGDRLKNNQSGRCVPPTPAQLTRISQYIQELQAEDSRHKSQGEEDPISSFGKGGLRGVSPKQVLIQLQALAHHLRDYRIHVRRGTLYTTSIDDPNASYLDSQFAIEPNASADDEDTTQAFLSGYRQAFEESLDAAIQVVVEQKVVRLSKRKGDRHILFLKGLQLFHCRGQTMGEIAPQLGYERQDKVTYLLKLKDLRADIRHETLKQLRDRILSLAKAFADPEQLQQLDQQLDGLLDEPLTKLITDAEKETTGAREGPLQSQFSRRLCHYLDQRTS